MDLPHLIAKRVLIADYDRGVADSLAHVFRAEGCLVKMSDGGQRAIDDVEAWAPDIALIDLFVEKTTGLDLAEQLRQRMPGLPIVFLYATIASHAFARAEAVVDRTFEKPVHPTILLAACDHLLAYPRVPKS